MAGPPNPRRLTIALVFVLLGLSVWWFLSPDPPPVPDESASLIDRLRPLHTPMLPPRPGDWLSQHEEDGQTFAEYIASGPIRATAERHVLYVQPVGDFTVEQRRIVDATADFLGRYFGLPVVVQPDLPSSVIPEHARRVHPSWGMSQILSTYVLHEVLAPRLPEDAIASLALTATDLWPGDGWNFVFGQASLRRRVGVWSMARNGDPSAGEDAYRLCLLRTLKTASHETGHMLSIRHCTAYECNMCGSNHQEESDRRPIALCPECVSKVCWSCDAKPAARFQRLIEFCDREGLAKESAFYRRSLAAVEVE